MYCPNCGKELPEGTKFCIECGTKLETERIETVNYVAEESEVLGNDTVDTFASIEEQSAAPMQEKPEPAQPTPVNTVPPVATNPAPANASFEISPNGKITSGKKGRTKFKDLSPKQKAIRFGIGGLLILIGLILFISDGIKGSEKAGDDIRNTGINNGIVVENKSVNYSGGVSFNITLDQFIQKYNDAYAELIKSDENYQTLGDSYIDSLIEANSLKKSDFIKADSNADYIEYSIDYRNIGIGLKHGSAIFSVEVDPNDNYIWSIKYHVDYALLGVNDSSMEHWLLEIPSCIFSMFDVDYIDKMVQMDENTHSMLINNIGYFAARMNNEEWIIMSACTSDSQEYSLLSSRDKQPYQTQVVKGGVEKAYDESYGKVQTIKTGNVDFIIANNYVYGKSYATIDNVVLVDYGIGKIEGLAKVTLKGLSRSDKDFRISYKAYDAKGDVVSQSYILAAVKDANYKEGDTVNCRFHLRRDVKIVRVEFTNYVEAE